MAFIALCILTSKINYLQRQLQYRYIQQNVTWVDWIETVTRALTRLSTRSTLRKKSSRRCSASTLRHPLWNHALRVRAPGRERCRPLGRAIQPEWCNTGGRSLWRPFCDQLPSPAAFPEARHGEASPVDLDRLHIVHVHSGNTGVCRERQV
ncbi:hypothetical protein CPB85DRAFT_164462 [Mucidula mucida]|nr:hypothetical protein CPB85DRAFT_164462 [Mucidula mucida]